ncbi:maleylacetate reductase [Neopusillimonas maritima]|uniref:Maleylacetate reductase n=1 Tax=Neopusillimonas maritima TaxID=2026239 RepID=A0A3A1YWS1_9BURK|nr:maleylacetate reductase [Neopusillimonas maritima]RIY41290.1 maleylacetate reductase [Neopusillimonas maritima]
MQTHFIYETLPARVIFGEGKLDSLGEELERAGLKKALILSTPHQADWAHEIATSLGTLSAGVFSQAAMHTPVAVTEDAINFLNKVGADCVVELGGGSTIGLGKAIALRTGLPQIAVPTTYAGSEMTPILGQTENGVKTTQKNPVIQPGTVIYDVNLTLTLPPALTATSGLNAMAHAVEALYAQDRNPIISLVAEEGIRAFAESLPAVIAAPNDKSARTKAQYGGWLCGICLGSAGMALHHKLCHVLGGSFDLPHSETHAIMLPHTAAYNEPAAAEAMDAVRRALGNANAGQGLWELAKSINAPLALKDLGFKETDIEKATEIALKNPYWNPRPLEAEGLRALLRRAWAGDTPQA